MKKKNIVLLLFVSIVGALLPLMPSVKNLEDSAIDLRFAVRGPIKYGDDVVVVAIDDRTDEDWRGIPKAFWLGKIAQLCTLVQEDGAKSIGLDMLISVDLDAYLKENGFSETPNQDFYDVAKRAKGVLFLGAKPGNLAEETRKNLQDDAYFLSVSTLQSDRTTIRALPRWDIQANPPMLAFANGLAKIDVHRKDQIDINFSGSEPTVVSASDLFYGLTEPGALAGKIVLIGETYSQSQDRINTPFRQAEAGVLVHAEAIQTLLLDRELFVVPIGIVAALGLFLGFASGQAAHVLSIGKYVCVAVVLAGIWSLGAQWIFTNKFVVVPVVAPMMTILLLSPLCVFAMKAIDERHERLWARSQWGQMVSDEFVAVLEAKRSAGLGTIESFNAALLFLDVAGFSEKSNRLPAEKVVEGLNSLFEPVIRQVNVHKGTVLNFIGDGVVAMFHSTEGGVEFRQRALNAALGVLVEVDALRKTEKQGEDWNVRIGMAVGDVNLALVGSKDRKQMTVYGTAVNMAARLEQAGKSLETRLALSQDFADLIGETGKSFEQYRIKPKGWDEEVEALALKE